MITFQEILNRLSRYWEKQGCIIHQGYDLEMGAGTFNPSTFLRCLGPEPYRAASIEPCRRPADGRYGTNPNRLQHFYQYQVILKPSPINMQEIYLESLEALGFSLQEHDIRFVHDDWESPTLGSWGLGWEVWMEGMEVTQYTYFQNVGGMQLKPVTGELTYGVERLAMYLQKVDSIYDIQWNEHLTYGDIYQRNEKEFSHYNFDESDASMWFRHFDDYEREANMLMDKELPMPAYDFVMKASHAFNMLDARGVISVTERTGYISRIRDLSCKIAESYTKSRELLGFPLTGKFQCPKAKEHHLVPVDHEIHQELLSATPNMFEDYVLEIGSEELPASFVTIGCSNLEKLIRELLEKEEIPFETIVMYGTPRRITAYVKQLAMAKPSKTEERRGPAVSAAFDSEGSIQPPGLGFLRSIKKTPCSIEEIRCGQDETLYIKDVKGKEYLFAKVTSPSRPTADILAEKLPEIILNIDFPKKMRWSDLDISYARPLRWLVSLFGNHIVPFTLANLTAGRESFGHRMLHPWSFALLKANDYLPLLRDHNVMADISERRKFIHKQLDQIETSINGVVIERDRVLDEVVNLVEWPRCVEASFDAEFLKAPKEVLISEMIEHQKYFPVEKSDGTLKNMFIITSNTKSTGRIREGNQKALCPRLADGVSLYEIDLAVPLDKFNKKLQNVTFQKELGTVYNKVERLCKHVSVLQTYLQISTPEKVKDAALICKSDLASKMVYEFPELQGVMGKYYALEHGHDPEVAQAIEEHWMPRGEKEPLPQTETGTIISLADKIDNLLGCFAVGLKPTSSSDPYALRRQALGIIRILIQGQYRLPLREVLKNCLKHFPENILNSEQNTLEDLEMFIINRIKTVFLDYGVDKDEIEASISSGFNDIYDTYCKVQSLHNFRNTDSKFPLLYEVYKRAKGQLSNQAKVPFSETLLTENAEISLNKLLNDTQQSFDEAIASKNYDEAYTLIATIQPALASLFDEVKILADDEKVRGNRLALLQKVFERFNILLDFSKLQER
ncbi:MAG: glycine--tRNA ligase [Chlamydiota bacterium]|nr:glycine--tRNA ligase [Chlamydiota bacterium]